MIPELIAFFEYGNFSSHAMDSFLWFLEIKIKDSLLLI